MPNNNYNNKKEAKTSRCTETCIGPTVGADDRRRLAYPISLFSLLCQFFYLKQSFLHQKKLEVLAFQNTRQNVSLPQQANCRVLDSTRSRAMRYDHRQIHPKGHVQFEQNKRNRPCSQLTHVTKKFRANGLCRAKDLARTSILWSFHIEKQELASLWRLSFRL